MNDPLVPFLDRGALRQLSHGHTACHVCSSLRCDGWDALSGAFDRSRLRRIGTLRRHGDDEPTLQEYHSAQTHAWSTDACRAAQAGAVGSLPRLDDLRVPPGNRLGALAGDRAGQHSIRINGVCFVWRDGAAHDVEIVDYH